jgi:cell shape-determining protein MreC
LLSQVKEAASQMLDSKKQTEQDNERLYGMLAEYKELLRECKVVIDHKTKVESLLGIKKDDSSSSSEAARKERKREIKAGTIFENMLIKE